MTVKTDLVALRMLMRLPGDLPKDLFSGKDFEYEKTKDGFVLRCRGKDLDKDEIYQYEFQGFEIA